MLIRGSRMKESQYVDDSWFSRYKIVPVYEKDLDNFEQKLNMQLEARA